MKSFNEFKNIDDLIAEIRRRQKEEESIRKNEKKESIKNSLFMDIIDYIDSHRPSKEETIRSDIGYEDNYDNYDKARAIILQLESSINGNGLISSDAFSRNIEYLFNMFRNEAEWILLITRLKNVVSEHVL